MSSACGSEASELDWLETESSSGVEGEGVSMEEDSASEVVESSVESEVGSGVESNASSSVHSGASNLRVRGRIGRRPSRAAAGRGYVSRARARASNARGRGRSRLRSGSFVGGRQQRNASGVGGRQRRNASGVCLPPQATSIDVTDTSFCYPISDLFCPLREPGPHIPDSVQICPLSLFELFFDGKVVDRILESTLAYAD